MHAQPNADAHDGTCPCAPPAATRLAPGSHRACATNRAAGAPRTARCGSVEPWIERSWQRCLAQGQRPQQRHRVRGTVTPQHMRQTTEAQAHAGAELRGPVLEQLWHAPLPTPATSPSSPMPMAWWWTPTAPSTTPTARADLITRIGVDLSERSVGTTAIGAALTELQPVWLHRGEHFLPDTSVYSCAGAPLFGPDGRCVGMLDLTGIDAVERPELKHLAAQSARSIENALVLHRPHSLLLRLNWPGHTLGDDTDGLLCLDADGWVCSGQPRRAPDAAAARPAGARRAAQPRPLRPALGNAVRRRPPGPARRSAAVVRPAPAGAGQPQRAGRPSAPGCRCQGIRRDHAPAQGRGNRP